MAALTVLTLAFACGKSNGPTVIGGGVDTGGSGAGGSEGDGGDGGFVDPNCEAGSNSCRLVPEQCGCPDGDRCVHSTIEGHVCIAEGNKALGEACDNDCAAGYVCIANGTGAPSVCHQYCLTNGDCVGVGARCILPLDMFDEDFCTEDCDPLGQTGCVATGTKCDLGLSDGVYTQCIGLGGGAQDTLCGEPSECDAGLTCISINGQPKICATWCDVLNPVCPGITTCGAFDPAVTLNGVELGVCG